MANQEKQGAQALFAKLQDALVRIENNRRLAWRDNLGDGYEVFEYLENISTWATGGLTDLTDLAGEMGVTLPEQEPFKTFKDVDFEEDPFPREETGEYEDEDEEAEKEEEEEEAKKE